MGYLEKIFDNRVQERKYKVLKEVAKSSWEGVEAFSVFNEIANTIVKKGESSESCCIYKDRAIMADRIRLALGGNKKNPNIVQVIDIACDECPEAGYVVTDMCRGCIAHSCGDACKLNAIEIDNHNKAHINKNLCVECGKCAEACPYSAIHNYQRPCEKSCKVDAISMGEGGEAWIDPEKCIDCGACVYHCPFGATVDVSSIGEIIKTIIGSENNTKYKVYATVAPSISSQFDYAKQGQVISAIRKLGFYDVVEVALGADMIAKKEAKELTEKGFLTSSCCPAFVEYIDSKFPELKKYVSTNLSPMAEIGKYIKEKDPDSKVIFIGPCIAKKAEVRKEEVKEYVDYVMTFEELQAMIDSKDILLSEQKESELNQASEFGKGFAKAGGLVEAIRHGVNEINSPEFEFKPVSCDGVENCKKILLRAGKGRLDNNFIEGMACEGGCIGGAGNLTHSEKNRYIVSRKSINIK
ncbi:MAG: 4Fe-4S dicluster domain-containing protein [Peptostreptococcaceae bacterium]|nr:4Fe-4S dicluster domain-containing protein [Peptostreptococcaceae bacterium]